MCRDDSRNAKHPDKSHGPGLVLPDDHQRKAIPRGPWGQNSDCYVVYGIGCQKAGKAWATKPYKPFWLEIRVGSKDQMGVPDIGKSIQ